MCRRQRRFCGATLLVSKANVNRRRKAEEGRSCSREVVAIRGDQMRRDICTRRNWSRPPRRNRKARPTGNISLSRSRSASRGVTVRQRA